MASGSGFSTLDDALRYVLEIPREDLDVYLIRGKYHVIRAGYRDHYGKHGALVAEVVLHRVITMRPPA